MSSVFGANKADDAADHEKQTEKLYTQIGQLKVENDFLKKNFYSKAGLRASFHD